MPFSAFSTNPSSQAKTISLLIAAMLSGVSTIANAEQSNNDSIRSLERSVYSTAELAASLTAESLPDPAAALNSVTPGATLDLRARHHPDWSYDEAWITDIGTLLYRDDDQDGFFAGFSLTLDSDTRYQHMDVHAVIDIQRPFGVREFLHKTSTFSLYENTFSDEYRVDIELVKNYVPGDYDLYIDLIDSNSHRILDSVSAQDFSNLSALPLESEDFDLLSDAPVAPQPIAQNDDVRVVEYAGSTGGFALLLLSAWLYARRARRGPIPTFILTVMTRFAASRQRQEDEKGDARLPARTSTLT